MGIINIWFANDRVIFAGNLEDLQDLMHILAIHIQEYGIDINKTKYMMINKNPSPPGQLRINDKV